MTISAAAIDLMVGAGASCAYLAIVARQHFPEIAETIDALVSAGAPVAVVAALIKAQAADRGAAAREEERRKANNEAQQKCRAKKPKKRAEVIQLNEPELPLSSLSYDSDDTHAPPPLKEKSPPTPPSKENNPSPVVDDDADRARVVSLISSAAQKLADEITVIAGIDPDPLACPPGWCGAAMQVQAWLGAGWPAEAIRLGVRTAMNSAIRKRDGPPATPKYFENSIMKAVAEIRRPAPNIPAMETSNEQAKAPHKHRRGGGGGFAILPHAIGADPESDRRT
jgi:hypothetical protein